MTSTIVPGWLKSLLIRAQSLLAKRAVRGFSHVLTGNVMVTASQAIQFLLLARALGPIEFSKIAAVASVVSVLLPFSGMGAANVMVMRASRDPGLLPLYFGNALLIAMGTGLLLTAASVAFITPLLGTNQSYIIMLVFCLSELIFSKIIDICWQVFISNERLHWTSIFLVGQSFSKLAAVALFMTFAAGRASIWVEWLIASNAVASACIVWMTTKQIGPPRFDWRLASREFSEGMPFSIWLSAKGFYTDADKLFLSRYGQAGSVGVYSVAFRVIQIALVLIRAVSFATQAKYFRAGVDGVHSSTKVAKRLAGPVVAAAMLMGIGFYVTAPLLSIAVGKQYKESELILKWLCGLPILLAGQSLLGDALAGSGNQRTSAAIQVLAAVLTCILCVGLIPKMDWRGAVVASYLSQIFLIVCLLAAVIVLRRRENAQRGRRTLQISS